MRRKFIVLLLTFVMVFSFTACGGDKGDNAGDDRTSGQITDQEQGDTKQGTDDNQGDSEQVDNPGEEQGNEDPDSTDDTKQTLGYEADPADNSQVAAKDAYYLENGDPTKGDDKSINGIPDAIDVLDSDPGDILVLVNKYHTVSKNYKPDGMVYMDNGMTTYQGLELKSEAYEAYKKMYKDACDLGYDLKVCSAYRQYSTQVTLYVNSLKNRGRETTNIRSAYPGRSEHHTGLCVDITSNSMGMTLSQDFADYPDGKWLNENCQDYGFIVRYPKGKTDITGYAYEPWHFRYVGVDVAKYIMENNLTLEEYLEAE